MIKTIQPAILQASLKVVKLFIIFVFLGGFSFAQNAFIKGKVVDENQLPLADVAISAKEKTVYSAQDGSFILEIPSKENVVVTFTQNGRKTLTQTFYLRDNEHREFTVLLTLAPDQIIELGTAEITFQSKKQNKPVNSVILSPKAVLDGPNLSGGITDILKTLPYVSSNTELSSQYMVRGGNYDENLIYVNGIQIYKPQLIRSGEQEGLGFVNPNLVEAINFSAGGWEAKYGDKMSSVLDIIYKRPKKLEGSLEASLIGGSLSLGAASKDQKLSGIIGARYNNKNLILNTLDSKSDFNPEYYDLQTNINYKISPKWDVSFLGTLTRSTYKMVPKNRETTFGGLDQPMKLTVYYDGQEKDKFNTETGALSFNYKASSRLNLTIDAFGFHSKEQEYFDIEGAYLISEIDGNGKPTQTYDIGAQIDHARNNFDVLVGGLQHRGKYDFNKNNNVEWGVQFQSEDIRDLLSEWQMVDSTGYSTPHHPKPGQINTNDLVLKYSVKANNKLSSNRISGYLQYTSKFLLNDMKVLFNVGLRSTYWDYNDEINLSPRAQIAIKPDWEKDMLFRFSTGLYYQPPFYREVRRLDGSLNSDVKAQQSIHFILGNDYEFEMMNRPFKLTTEAYYKILNRLNPYFIDNVRVRYTAENNAKGHAYGLDMRIFGEFVPGIDSWFSFSYARAYQNIDDRGNISSPTDPKFKVSLFFQDYMPILPSFKVNINLIYTSGLPNGAPQFTDPYQYTKRLSDYKRVDIGFIKEIINTTDLKPRKESVWGHLKELSIGVDVYNLLDIRNEISNTWIQDVNSNRIFAVPNRLTGRFFNAKLKMTF